MKLKIIFIVVALIIVGCVAKSGPVNNANFESILKLSDLQGKYRNKGDAGDIGHDIYLSRFIWPNDNEIAHENIEFVEVRQLNDKTIIVKALINDNTAKKEQFLLGKDFSFENGRINIDREGGVAGFKSGDPMLGLYYGNVTLGLDKMGHGKLRSSGAAVGMVYMVIPLAMKAQEDVRFERIE